MKNRDFEQKEMWEEQTETMDDREEGSEILPADDAVANGTDGLPRIGAFSDIPPFVFGEKIPFELPEIESGDGSDVTGYLEISPNGEDGSWTYIDRDIILPVSCDGYLIRLHASNSVGEAVSNPVRLHIEKATVDMSRVRWVESGDMVYDGKPKSVWIEGLPEGIEPSYTGNEATDAGTYVANFSFDFDQDNFTETIELGEHEWTIKKAPLDVLVLIVAEQVDIGQIPHCIRASYFGTFLKPVYGPAFTLLEP